MIAVIVAKKVLNPNGRARLAVMTAERTYS